VVIPTELPGVIGVTADGHATQSNGGYLKSFYSTFGISTADVVILDCTHPEAPTGCSRYGWIQGTSMASPHVAGVAALIISRFGTLAGANDATMSPGKVSARIQQTADAQPCPATLPDTYLTFLGTDDEQVQTCTGGLGQNSWYGSGQVNALSAVSR
jgi:lantibiotic leader peptide-processing serine protease